MVGLFVGFVRFDFHQPNPCLIFLGLILDSSFYLILFEFFIDSSPGSDFIFIKQVLLDSLVRERENDGCMVIDGLFFVVMDDGGFFQEGLFSRSFWG